MHQPLLQLLFPAPTRSISRPIDVIITDLFVLPPVWEGYQRNIMTYLFIPGNLMAFIRYINITLDKIKSGKLPVNFDRHINETISFVRGLIFNSILEFDEQILNELRRQSLPGSNMPILFVAPLMPEDLDQKRNVKTKV